VQQIPELMAVSHRHRRPAAGTYRTSRVLGSIPVNAKESEAGKALIAFLRTPARWPCSRRKGWTQTEPTLRVGPPVWSSRRGTRSTGGAVTGRIHVRQRVARLFQRPITSPITSANGKGERYDALTNRVAIVTGGHEASGRYRYRSRVPARESPSIPHSSGRR